MSRYRSYGALDDVYSEDLDVGFIGYNNRLRPDQLQRGMLTSSINGRLDRRGQWQVRKGMENVSAPFTVGGTSLTLPTSSQITAGTHFRLPFTITGAVVSSNVMTLTTSETHGISVGDKIVVEGLRFSGGQADPNGEKTTASGTTGTTIKYDLNPASDATYTVSNGIVLNFSAFPNDPTNYGSAASYGELSNHLFLPHTGETVSTTLSDASNTEVTASCRFSDNSVTNEEFIIMSAVANASAFNTSTNESFNMLFPDGETIPTNSSIIQALNKIIIFRKEQAALECTKFFKALDIASAIRTSSDATVTVTTSTPHGFAIGDPIGIEGVSGNLDPTGVQSVNTVPTTTSFTYELGSTTGADDPYTLSSARVVPVFAVTPRAEFTQPVSQTLAAKDFAVINSTATAVTTASLSKGDNITLTDPSSTGLAIGTELVINEVFEASSTTVTINAVSISGTTVTIGCSAVHGLSLHQPIELKLLDSELNGKQVVSTIDSTTAFKVEVASTFSVSDTAGTVEPAAGISFIVGASDISTVKTQAEQRAATPTFIKRVSQGGGYIHMPFPEYGVFHQKRLVVPHFFDVLGTQDIPVSTDRKNRDEIIFSDILDTNTYDAIFGQFRFNAGTADFNVGLHSFNEDNLLVFNRNSIHLVSNTINLKNSVVKFLTGEVGCIARKSIQQIANQILFLSDNGIYAVSFIDQYNLRGNEVPLSEPINLNIENINLSLADKATSVYFDNKYYISLPMDYFRVAGSSKVFFTENDALNYVDGESVSASNPDGTGNTFVSGDKNRFDVEKNLITKVSATGNNVTLIYNFLNKQWESLDFVTNSSSFNVFDIDTNFNILDLVVAGKGSERAVYAVNGQGGVHKFDSTVSGDDLVISTIGETSFQPRSIAGQATTRMFTFNSIDKKKWRQFDLSAESSIDTASTFRLSAVTENIDYEFALNEGNSYSIAKQEDVAIRGRIGQRRAYGIQFLLNTTTGRPILKGVKAQGSTSNRKVSIVE